MNYDKANWKRFIQFKLPMFEMNFTKCEKRKVAAKGISVKANTIDFHLVQCA